MLKHEASLPLSQCNTKEHLTFLWSNLSGIIMDTSSRSRSSLSAPEREELHYSPRHSLGSCVAADQNQASWVSYQTALCRTFHICLRRKQEIMTLILLTEQFYCTTLQNNLHFPLKTAIRGLYFFSFSTRIVPPSRSSLLWRWTHKRSQWEYALSRTQGNKHAALHSGHYACTNIPQCKAVGTTTIK